MAEFFDTERFARLLRDAVPALPVRTIEPAGEGDYCQAFAVDGDWIFLVAKHEQGRRSLERIAVLLPQLAQAVDLSIPRATYVGSAPDGGFTFVGYQKLGGVPLSSDRYQALSAAQRARFAATLARFLRQVHRFPLDSAAAAGVVACPYPFAATEDGLDDRSAEVVYHEDLAHLHDYAEIDRATRDSAERILTRHLADPANLVFTPALLHGEVSAEHVLYDPATSRISGVIDFNGVVIGDPDQDLLYLYEDYGLPFISLLFNDYPVADRRRTLDKLEFYHQWLTLLWLLRALDHDYAPGIAGRSREVLQLQGRE